MEAIRHAGLVDCIVVTTRYFGGTLFRNQRPGEAYTAAAAAAISQAKVLCVRVCVRGVWTVDYPLYETAVKLPDRTGCPPGRGTIYGQSGASLCDACGHGRGVAAQGAAAVPGQCGDSDFKTVSCAFLDLCAPKQKITKITREIAPFCRIEYMKHLFRGKEAEI